MLINTQLRAEGSNPWRRLGKVKLGIKVRGRLKCTQNHDHGDACYTMFPKDLDYFVVPPELAKALGNDKPKELDIVLMNPQLHQNFDTRAAMYAGNNSRVCHTNDDRTAQRYMKPPAEAKHRWVTMECPNLECSFRKEKKCQEKGYFHFMIPATGEIGTYMLVLGSKVGMAQIYTALTSLEALCAARSNGMFGIRLKLRREARTFFQDLDGTGQQAKVIKHIPVIDINYAQLMLNDQKLLGPMLAQPVMLPNIPTTLDPHDTLDAADE